MRVDGVAGKAGLGFGVRVTLNPNTLTLNPRPQYMAGRTLGEAKSVIIRVVMFAISLELGCMPNPRDAY